MTSSSIALQQQFHSQMSAGNKTPTELLIVSYSPVFTIARDAPAGAQFSFLNINF